MRAEFTLRLKRGHEKALVSGYPWIMRGDFVASSEQALCGAGALAEVVTAKGAFVGIASFNADAPIPGRIFSRKRGEAIDEDFFRARLQNALTRRKSSITVPYYRLVHSEADGLPGAVIDRFDDIFVLQLSTAGMERLQEPLLAALEALFSPRALLLRGDIPAREQEGLPREVRRLKGEIPPRVAVQENGLTYFADLLHGQKTGWFYDQRANRALVADYAKDRAVLDLYCHSGGFGLLAAQAGARSVVMADSSGPALELAKAAAEKAGITDFCSFIRRDAFDAMAALVAEKRRFGVVVADPPAFVKTRADLASGMRGYAKVARLCAPLVEEGGVLFIAACSHHATPTRFREAVLSGLKESGRIATVLAATGHAADHPLHPHLPQSEYLKGLLIRLG